MEEKLNALYLEAEEKLNAATTSQEIECARIEFTGKSGKLTAILKDMKNVPAEERPKVGQLVNALREKIEKSIAAHAEALAAKELRERLESEEIDITLPAKTAPAGALHPLNLVKKEIIGIFQGMGFSVVEGPEIETDYNAFEALNLPKDHPAREMQDTFYITDNIVLRPHTSPAQIRAMTGAKGSIKILSPGRVYRADDDATHSPMFHQIEGLVVDRGVSLCDLKGLLDEFAKKIFGGDAETRFRPSYFPFTEPSVEVDVTCTMCGGKGCKLCKGTGWIEVLGAGVIHTKVLENCGIDAKIYSGLAFGIGIERITMLKYAIPDIRLLFENDLRLLSQFEK